MTPPRKRGETPELTPNQLVAANLSRARALRGWTQEDAARRLQPYLGQRWSRASFSAAERSVEHPDKQKQFSADELVALAATFELPVSFFLNPIPGRYLIRNRNADKRLDVGQVARMVGHRPDERERALIEQRIAEQRRELEGGPNGTG